MTLATSYTELIGAIREKVGERGIRYVDFDDLASFAPGLTGKAFGPSQVKRLGIEKVFDALRAASLRLRVEDDPEQLAKMQKQMSEKCQTRQANQARMGNSASPISRPLRDRVYGHFLKEARKKRWVNTSKKQRSEHARMMAMAGVKKRRKQARKRARQRAAAHKARRASSA